jgi:divalent metal cation (Fe/Co/Zn/Cd) transporter
MILSAACRWPVLVSGHRRPSLAVLLGEGGVALGWDWADPVVGLLITLAILTVLRQAARRSTAG